MQNKLQRDEALPIDSFGTFHSMFTDRYRQFRGICQACFLPGTGKEGNSVCCLARFVFAHKILSETPIIDPIYSSSKPKIADCIFFIPSRDKGLMPI
jgi:hypothetical protein